MSALTPLQRCDAHPFMGMDVPGLLEQRAHARRDHPFIVWEPFEGLPEVISYGMFYERVRRIAGGLQQRGVRAGDCVLIHLENCPETILAWYACAWLGAIAVTTNARASDDELQYYAEHCGAVGGITQPKFAARVAASCKGLRWLAVTATDSGHAPQQGAPDAASSFAALDAAPAPRRPADPLAPCSVQYTSGTTSRPKAVLWTHANALWGARINAAHEDLRAEDVHLVHLPLFHTNAQAYSVLACLWVGATAVVLPRFSASRFWPVSIARRVTWTSMIPFCIQALLAHEVPAEHYYRLWGAAACALPTDAHFRVQTIGWWGMTETITHGIVSDRHLPSLSMSIGRPAAEYRIAIVEDDSVPVREARHVGPGGSGQLLIQGVRGLSLFQEYLGNAKATAESFDPDGWFRTGDRVDLLEEGSIRFGDRTKDMLKVGGENVAASEIERVIQTVPGVAEGAVVGRAHPMLDEVPVAFVIAAPNAPADLAERILAACRQQLADFKCPHEVRIVPELPRATLEKVAKAQLRQMLAQEGA
ncbi:AMP-binding protein [Extensimonas sp. H3M7-6]|uniref:AMP-binding protein n=1 Tax=Extensimonas soli TaxID=3031322 RepID=UPI0023DBFDFC|nr:AMP-binding protein [Extensimonas sp. H3M7-6]MDF1482010.1 AMP-binding protein [Extensimonas sp. H3M7-6]